MAREPRYGDAAVAAIADNEGWGYMVTGYMPARYCANPETARLFQAAGDALRALKEQLQPYEDASSEEIDAAFGWAEDDL